MTMTDQTPSQEAPPDREALLRDSDFVARWNAGDPAALKQLDAVTRATVAADPGGDRPRPPNAAGLNELLSQDQARRLAQASVDAGQDPAVVLAALADSDPDWRPDMRPKAEREWQADHELGHAERYRIDGMERAFDGEDPQEIAALDNTVREFVASLGFDRSGGSELASDIARAITDQRGLRPDARSMYEQRQAAMLGERRDQLVKEAASALAGVHPDLVSFMHRSGALSNANVVMALAHMAQARAVRG